MPPSLPRPALSGLEAALTNCRLTPRPVSRQLSRSLSTTPSYLQQFFPPDSPKFITIPEPPQSSEVKPPPVKGHLPKPRNLFPTRGGHRKATSAFIKAATPLSKSEAAGLPPKSAAEAAHRKAAAIRRKNLAAGTLSLYRRKTTHDRRILERSQYKVGFNIACANKPEREDEILTRSTVKASTALKVQVEPSPLRFERAEEARQKTEQLAAQKSEARKDALAQLFVAAQSFIVTEKQLEERVEELFKEDTFKNRISSAAKNIWEASGPPISVATRQAQISGMASGLSDSTRAATQAAVRRKLVAEELSGGKLVIDA
ncbi:uncharacterized protein PODANS_1_6470 [Podospora anserina S mat+]|uniref:Podospora anserina S mat+ genomic DNA chromosome 1, supercontig 1 n=1 Tax=Podospora anserina (strain S / ATCC MYA-4624 / DSM 980 / FGSC 10383) TaxID=515849 RepID=B2AB85_PODAN|nr:uncharacterized protein PODANS_1_6470 [Podospora anserina S mat+]CAP60347.1 unnamed protein product [Podospora anserina S mat+]CDP22986.1 Putative protein of unknown function [Podospora anserina S mat+]